MLLPIEELNRRITQDKTDGDTAYFNALMLLGELLVKLTVSGLVAALEPDVDRTSEKMASQLVRANGLGTWIKVLDEILEGPSSLHLHQGARESQKQLTQIAGSSTGQLSLSLHKSITESLRRVGLDVDQSRRAVSLRNSLSLFVQLRNKTKAHGATRPAVFSAICPDLATGFEQYSSEFDLFNKPWAYLHRNLSGKYRVSNWNQDGDAFDRFKSSDEYELANGIYIDFGEPKRVNLIFSDADSSDVWLPNGQHGKRNFEVLSYATGSVERRESSHFNTPIQQLPTSDTTGRGELDTIGRVWTNVPDDPNLTHQYIERDELEAELERQIVDTERHPIVTLTGRGGIGKTSVALRTIHKLFTDQGLPYELVIWFSSRDIDLLPDGPKTVRPDGVTIRDFAQQYGKLVGRPASKPRDSIKFFSEQFVQSELGPTLFVFDNFETTANPTESYEWLDTYVRPPNKIVITSRDRRFTGDYSITVRGMSDSQANLLIDVASRAAGIENRISDKIRREIIEEAGGHPYIIKILVGELAKDKSANHIERIVAAQDQVLNALFERSYARLSPAAQRVFLTTCRWRSTIPQLALEAIISRPANEKFDVQSAIEELIQYSFVELMLGEDESEMELLVPLAARLFGVQKLETSSWNAAIEADIQLLYMFGAAKPTDVTANLRPRVKRMFTDIARRLDSDTGDWDELGPIIEYVGTRHADTWKLLAELASEYPKKIPYSEEECLLKFLEMPGDHDVERSRIWHRIADIRASEERVSEEFNALVHACTETGTPIYVVSDMANRINRILSLSDTSDVARDEEQIMIRDVVNVLAANVTELDPTDLSRLAWMYIRLGRDDDALKAAERGLSQDPENQHCLGVVTRLGP